MEKNIVTKRLFRFLKERGIFEAFLTAFKDQRAIRHDWVIYYSDSFNDVPDYFSVDDYCIKIKDKREIFNYAFRWEDSHEGHNFWSETAKKWQDDLLLWNEYFKII